MISTASYPVDTADDGNVWVVMRRVHWHTDDLIAHRLHQRGIRTAERRLLDALSYAHRCRLQPVSTAALCALAPSLKAQTAASVLARLNRTGLVEEGPQSDGRLRQWQLTEAGTQTREDYSQEAERQLQILFDTRTGGEANALLDRVPSALDLVYSRMFPRVQHHSKGTAEQTTPPSTAWSALRQIHLYLSDYTYRETELFGIGPVERRVLDAIGYARKNGGPPHGLNVGTLCRLSEAVTRPVIQTALENLRESHVVEQHRIGDSRRSYWSLTETGESIREAYKRLTQIHLREVYDPDQTNSAGLLSLMRQAHQVRDRRLLPALNSSRYAH